MTKDQLMDRLEKRITENAAITKQYTEYYEFLKRFSTRDLQMMREIFMRVAD